MNVAWQWYVGFLFFQASNRLFFPTKSDLVLIGLSFVILFFIACEIVHIVGTV